MGVDGGEGGGFGGAAAGRSGGRQTTTTGEKASEHSSTIGSKQRVVARYYCRQTIIVCLYQEVKLVLLPTEFTSCRIITKMIRSSRLRSSK